MPLRDANGKLIRPKHDVSSFRPSNVPQDMLTTQQQVDEMNEIYHRSMMRYAGILERSCIEASKLRTT